MRYIPWTDEEIRTLRELWVNPKVTIEDLTKLFRVRSLHAIKHKAADIGLKNYGHYRVTEERLNKDVLREIKQRLTTEVRIEKYD